MAILVQSNKKPSVSFPSQTGSIVTFNSPFADLPLKSCKVNIPVAQEGTGDPSPYNIRNFVGVNSAVLKVSRHSTVIETLSGIYVDANGIIGPSLSPYPYRCVIAKVKQGDTYTYSVNGTVTFIPVMAFFDKYPIIGTQSYNRSRSIDNNATFVAPINGYVFIRGGGDFNEVNQMVATGTNTDYEQGNTYTFTFGQTIYAGELDVLTGILTVTHVYLHITTVNVMNSQRANVGVGGNRTVAVQLDQNELRCNILKSETFSSALDNHIHFSNVQTLQLYMAEEIGTTVAEWETWLSDHPLYVCYKLETPEVINLGGMDIETLQGENNLFASTGETTASYIKIGG